MKKLALIVMVLLVVGVVVGTILVGKEQELRGLAYSGKLCSESSDCILLKLPGDKGSFEAPKPINHIYISAGFYKRYDKGETNDSCLKVRIRDRFLEWDKEKETCQSIENIQVKVASNNAFSQANYGSVSCNEWSFFFNHPLDEEATVTVLANEQVIGKGSAGPTKDNVTNLSGPWTGRPVGGVNVKFIIEYLGTQYSKEVEMLDCSSVGQYN